MNEFNYSEFDVETLNRAINRAMMQIKKIENDVKRFKKKLTIHEGRGFSNDKKKAMQNYIKYAPALISKLEEEIALCKADIANRD